MNKTEAEYSELLEARKKTGELDGWWFEPMTLKLARDTRWTPDFLVMLPDGRLEFHEVKGFMEQAAWIRIKVAAEKFAWLAALYVVRRVPKKDGGGWKIEEVGPTGTGIDPAVALVPPASCSGL
jgi:hypothetical protein